MKYKAVKISALIAAAMFLSFTVIEFEAHARAGGSRSSGSRGTRSYSQPASPTTPQTNPSRQQQAAPSPSPAFQQPAAGGFMRSMAGGIVGGMLGGMLFRSMGFGGAGGGMGGGGGGIGLFEIILIAGIGYLIYRYIKKRREAGSDVPPNQVNYQGANTTQVIDEYQNPQIGSGDVETGLRHIRQFDPYFDENRFNDLAMDNFFKVQGAWMNRDLAPAAGIITDEMRRTMQQDIDKLLRDKQVNKLENVAVRKVEIAEVWQESGQDYITVLINANLLDYTTDENSGTVLSGSKSDPVKFEEFWTFTRPVGNNPWKLSAIDQR